MRLQVLRNPSGSVFVLSLSRLEAMASLSLEQAREFRGLELVSDKLTALASMARRVEELMGER